MPDNTNFPGFGSPNYTQVPDELFDQLMPDLSGAELKVLLYIIRRTFGFKKNSDPISFNQFLSGIKGKNDKTLDRGCGIKNATTLSSALKSLEEKGIITSQKAADERGSKQTTIYSLHFRSEPNHPPPTKNGGGGTTKTVGGVLRKSYIQETVKQETENTSSIREESSQKNEEAREPEQQPQHQEKREVAPLHPGSLPEQSLSTQSPGLSRQYLSAAHTQIQPKTHGLASIASVLPKPPQQPQRTYTQDRQVLVDVIADLAREFRDEAKLTESVSRAYNLMAKAKISDISVFTSKIYEARSITKERYGTITRRMPYFFSVLQDICGLKPKPSGQTGASG
jgi:Bacteriophage replication protein O